MRHIVKRRRDSHKVVLKQATFGCDYPKRLHPSHLNIVVMKGGYGLRKGPTNPPIVLKLAKGGSLLEINSEGCRLKLCHKLEV